MHTASSCRQGHQAGAGGHPGARASGGQPCGNHPDTNGQDSKTAPFSIYVTSMHTRNQPLQLCDWATAM